MDWGSAKCTDPFKRPFKEHRRTLDNANTKSIPTTVAEYFLSSPHNISKEIQLIPIEKIFSNRGSIHNLRPGKLFSFQNAGQLIPKVLISAKKRIGFQFIIFSHFRYYSVTLSI